MNSDVERLRDALCEAGLIYMLDDGTPQPGLIEGTDLTEYIAKAATILATKKAAPAEGVLSSERILELFTESGRFTGMDQVLDFAQAVIRESSLFASGGPDAWQKRIQYDDNDWTTWEQCSGRSLDKPREVLSGRLRTQFRPLYLAAGEPQATEGDKLDSTDREIIAECRRLKSCTDGRKEPQLKALCDWVMAKLNRRAPSEAGAKP